MRLSSLIKKMSGLFAAILAAALSIFFISNYFIHEGFEHHFQKDLQTMRKVVDDELANLKDRLLQEVLMLSQSVELQRAFRARDTLLLASVARAAKDVFHASFATITDAQGIVLARGYWNKAGDSIADSYVMQQALNGNASVDVVKLRNNGLSIGAAAPVYVDGNIVGALLFGMALRTHAFVDGIKRSTDLEMTVFDHDERISTTIVRDGQRAVGTKLDNAQIAKKVLQDGGIYSDDVNILGKAYKTVYWPIQDSHGSTLGMWFIGTEVQGLRRTVTNVALSCLAATLLIACALSCVGVVFIRSMINPLERKAYVDKLTGINNRAGFERGLSFILSSRPKSGTLFLIDLDEFKEINDNLGHPTGDECLKRAASLLREVFRGTDLVARLGGDEFVVFAPTLSDDTIIRDKAQEFLDILAYTYRLDNGRTLTVTASIGIARYPEHGKSYTPLYNNADKALYAAKEGGRNQYVFYPVCLLDKTS